MFEEEIAQAVRALKAGGVVAFPTESFYGLAVNPMIPAALQRLLEIKGRDVEKGIPVVAADYEVANAHFVVPDSLKAPLTMIWPAPLTVAIEPRQAFPKELCGAFDTIAVRVPANSIARELASKAGGLITATSANFSGEPPCRAVTGLDARLLEKLDYVLDTGIAPGGTPSTIVGLEPNGLRVFREGAYDLKRLSEICALPCLT